MVVENKRDRRPSNLDRVVDDEEENAKDTGDLQTTKDSKIPGATIFMMVSCCNVFRDDRKFLVLLLEKTIANALLTRG